MTFDVNFWELLGGIGSLVGFLCGAVWGFGKLTISQFNKNLDQRFDSLNQMRTESNHALEDRFDSLRETFEEKHAENKKQWDGQFNRVADLARENEKELLRLKAELPYSYVMREDWIRFSGTIDSKLDSLWKMLDGVREKVSARD